MTRALESLGSARRGGAAVRPWRADLDAFVQGLTVVLHESIHETGPKARDDILLTRSGRAFEEGFAEAGALDMVRPFIAGLRMDPGLRAALLEAVGRYRPAYRPQVAWVRGLSATATHRPAGSARARAWRIRVADHWGTDRWSLLAAATGRDEASLRSESTAGGRPARPR